MKIVAAILCRMTMLITLGGILYRQDRTSERAVPDL
jgi:hypothetical protein